MLRAAQRKRLKRLAASTAASLRLVLRARIVLRAAGGSTNAAIAAALDLHLDTVRRWRRRFASENIENLANAENADYAERPVAVMLDDRPRSGRPRSTGSRNSCWIVGDRHRRAAGDRLALDPPLLAEHLAEPVGICASQIGRILASF